MSRIGRSARTREQRIARRRADVQGFDRGGGRRSIFRSRYAKIFYLVGLVGMLGSLIPVLLLSGGGHSGTGVNGPVPVSRLSQGSLDVDTGRSRASRRSTRPRHSRSIRARRQRLLLPGNR